MANFDYVKEDEGLGKIMYPDHPDLAKIWDKTAIENNQAIALLEQFNAPSSCSLKELYQFVSKSRNARRDEIVASIRCAWAEYTIVLDGFKIIYQPIPGEHPTDTDCLVFQPYRTYISNKKKLKFLRDAALGQNK